VAAVACLCCMPAFAQDEQPEPTPRFDVEVIVFAYAQNVGLGSERFELPDAAMAPPATALSDFTALQAQDDDPVSALSDAPSEPASPQAGGRRAAAPERIEPDYLLATTPALPEAMSTLDRLDVYRPLYAASWSIEAPAQAEALTLSLEDLAEPPPGLSGEFTLYLSRFLHLDVDLEFTPVDESRLPVAITGLRETTVTEPTPIAYRIDEDRIFRSGELRYFDHPKFGVLARVTRIEEPEEDDIAEADAT